MEPILTLTRCVTVALLLLVALGGTGTLDASLAQAAPAPAHEMDPIPDFRALAKQRPWPCPLQGPSEAGALRPGAAACAWQNRLRKYSWRWNDDPAPSCVSRQAVWWNRAQAILPPNVRRDVWDRRWTVRTLRMTAGDQQRLLLLQRDRDGQWRATEWQWDPSPRPATRRWQAARWQLLVDAAAGPRFRDVAADTPDAARMRPVFRQVLGVRPGEMHGQGMRLEADGLCLEVGNPLPGPSKLHLLYSENDSRLEQRAAMHLQLSRLHPDASWLTQFKLLELPARLPHGAKFLATWVESRHIVSQLWMPTRDDSATVRVRISAALPHRKGDAMAAAEKAKPLVERELAAIAAHWAAAYE